MALLRCGGFPRGWRWQSGPQWHYAWKNPPPSAGPRQPSWPDFGSFRDTRGSADPRNYTVHHNHKMAVPPPCKTRARNYPPSSHNPRILKKKPTYSKMAARLLNDVQIYESIVARHFEFFFSKCVVTEQCLV